MRLSVCLIVRDEATRLADAIASVRGVADEIIVVDTGSQDGSPELAASLGARVSHFKWCDDFAAARNESFRLARGEWILMLDADQRVINAQALQREFEGEAYRVRIIDTSVESWRVALFRAPARMIGRIHEYLHPARPIRDLELQIRHVGYENGPSEAKHRRNLPLLKAELAERPERLDVRIEKARTLAAVGDEGAEAALWDALDRVDSKRPPESPTVAMLLETFLLRTDAPTWTEEYALRWFPNAPPIRWLLGRRAAEAGDFEQALSHLRRLVEMSQRDDYDRSIGFDQRLLGPQPRFQMAGMLVRLGELDEADEIYRSVENDPTVGPNALQNRDALRRVRETSP